MRAPRWPRSALAATLALLAAAACGDNVVGVDPPDAGPPDAAPPDAAPPTLGPSFVVDDLHIAGFTEDAHAFSLLGQVLDPQLQQAIAGGTLLLGLELRDLDDRTGRSDDAVTVGMYNLQDGDGDPADNFDADAPEVFTLPAGAMTAGEPTVLFTEASIASSELTASGVGALDLLGGAVPLPLYDPIVEGRLVADGEPGAEFLRTLDDGRLRTAVPVAVLAVLPNLATGTCPGATMLDVLVGGCGFPLSLQPDVDLDGDGVEAIRDTDGDGAYDQCIDGDGTVIDGAGCATNPAIADGYRLIFVLHGVRAWILAPDA